MISDVVMRKHPHGKSRTGHGSGTQRPNRPAAGRPAAAPDRLVTALAAFGALLAAYLWLAPVFGGAPAFCTDGSDCDLIQASRFSQLLGLPVALWGLGLYLAIAVIAWRSPARLKRWRTLWALALIGVAVSAYLTLASAIELHAACPWCLLSLATIIAIFIAIVWRRPEVAPGGGWRNWLLSSAIGVAMVLTVLHVVHSGLLQGRTDPRLTALAAHLDRTGAKFYGASWCPTCTEQKRLFGTAADALPYVECSPRGRGGPVAMACISAGIDGYPTWIIRGQRYQEIIEPERLARLSGYLWRDPNQP